MASPPKPIELTESEKSIAAGIPRNLAGLSNEEIRPLCDCSHDLMVSLLARNAIPAARWAFFDDPEHCPAGKSRRAIYEQNGNSGAEVYRHANFLELHLPYILNGPQLPPESIEGFCKIINDDVGTSGMVLTALEKFARKQVRERGLDRHQAGDAFYLLCLECDKPYLAAPIRKAAMTTK